MPKPKQKDLDVSFRDSGATYGAAVDISIVFVAEMSLPIPNSIGW